MKRYILAMLTAASAIAMSQPAVAAWQRASSKHFIIYSDSSPQRLRDFAGRLEKFDKAVRYVRNMSDPEIGDGNRVTLFVVSDQDAVVKLARDKSGTVAGFYAGRVSGSIAVIPKSLHDETRAGAMTSETVFFHEYSHHLMLSDTDTPYPEWLIEGFAEFMSTARFERDGSVGLGAPAQFRAYEVLGESPIPLERLLAGGYYRLGRLDKSSFYGRSWLLTHYLNFTPSRRGQLTTYLDEFAKTGNSLAAARHAFGDLKTLEHDLSVYLNKSTMTYVKVRPDLLATGPVTIEALSPGAEAVMRDRIQSKVGVDRTTAEPLAARVRLVEQRFRGDPFVERTLAEAELDAGHPDAALAAAERVLQANPRDVEAMLYKGRAIEGGKSAGRFAAARNLFVAANKIDTEDPEPLALFYGSYVREGVKPNANAVEALHYASNLAPQDTGVRMNSAIQYLRDGHVADGRALLTAVAFDPHGEGAAKVAQAMLDKIDAGDVKAALASSTPPAAAP